MKRNSPQRSPEESHGHSPDDPHDDQKPHWLMPLEEGHPPRGDDPSHRVKTENHEASHMNLRIVDNAIRLLKSCGYLR